MSEKDAGLQRDYRSVWDSYAKRYVADNRSSGAHLGDEWGSHEKTVAAFDKYVAPVITGRDSVVELGVGGGKHTALAVSKVTKVIYGLDISPEMLRLTTERLHSHPGKFVGLLTNGERIPLKKDEVDAFYSLDAMVHIFPYDLFRYLREVSRVLKVGGRGVFEFADWDGPKSFEKFRMDADVFYRDGREMSSGAFGFITRGLVSSALKSLDMRVDDMALLTGRTSVVTFSKV